MDDQTKTPDVVAGPKENRPKIKSQKKPHKKNTAKQDVGKSATGKGTPWTFPKNVLADAI
jgi:hypothetical protein